MADNGTSVSVPVLEYVLEHASNSIKLINEKLDDLASSDFGGLRAGSVSHVKHDVADEIQQMATAARAHYDDWVLANPGATFDAGGRLSLLHRLGYSAGRKLPTTFQLRRYQPLLASQYRSLSKSPS